MGTLELVKSILNGEKIAEEEIEKSNPYYYLQERNHGRFGFKYGPDTGLNAVTNTNNEITTNKVTLKNVVFINENFTTTKVDLVVDKNIAERYKKGEFGYKFKPGLESVTKLRKECAKNQKAIKENEPFLKDVVFDNDDLIFKSQVTKLIKQVEFRLSRQKITCPALESKKVYVISSLTDGHLKKHTIKEQRERAPFIRFIPEIIERGKLLASQLQINELNQPVIRHDLVGCCKVKNKFYAVSLIIDENSEGLLHITLFNKEIQKSISMSMSENALNTLSVGGNLMLNSNTIFVHGLEYSSNSLTSSSSNKGNGNTSAIPTKTLNILPQNKIKSMPTVNKSILHDDVTINIKDVTVGNRQAKIDCLEKSFTDKLNYGKALVEYVEKDDTPVLKDLITLRIARFDKSKIDKAVRTLSFSLDTELKAPKGEAFTYKAQEDLTNLFVKELTEKTKELYTMLVAYFGLPEMRILTKANLIYKGKVVYSPETGKPISEKDWAKFVDALEKFLNRNYKGIGKRIVLSADALGRILDRLTDTKKLEEIKKLRLDELKYKGKKLEWISDSVKNMSNTFGESLSRIQQAKIQVMTQSAAQRVTNVTDKMRGDIQQILIDGVKNHQSKSQVSQALFDKCVGLNRDFQRIADTEIHNAATEAYINEEVYKTPEGKKVYFKRFEILDGNTCKKCSSIDGMIALYSDTPLSSQKIVDEYAEIAIWEGCGILNDKEIPMSGCHPYCRGAWIRYYPETEKEVKEMMQ